jgi:hypothetical protein
MQSSDLKAILFLFLVKYDPRSIAVHQKAIHMSGKHKKTGQTV